MQKYLVGGCVRDELLGLTVQDRDWVVVGSTPQQMANDGFQQVGNDFPVFLHPETKEEYALARTERKTAKGYYGFECNAEPSVTLEQDLCRRDLTINAIAKDDSGELIDPYNGQEDLKNKILRHVSPAFSEDPVRILRVARFAARFAKLGFVVADETMSLMKQMVNSGEVNALVAERVWSEMKNALSEDNPEVFFHVLRECGALAIIFPQLDCLWGVPQSKEYHPEIDTGLHTMLVLQQAVKFSNKTQIRFAALCHDLGKGLTPKSEWPKHKGHEHRGIQPINEWCDKYRVPKDYKTLALKVSKYHLHAHRALELKASTFLEVLKALDVFRNPHLLEDYLLACKADRFGRYGSEDATFYAYEIFNEVYKVCIDIDSAQFIEQGFQGVELGKKIDLARVDAIEKLLNKLKKNLE